MILGDLVVRFAAWPSLRLLASWPELKNQPKMQNIMIIRENSQSFEKFSKIRKKVGKTISESGNMIFHVFR